MKSAYELAMERLNAENPDAGKELTDEQKSEIGEINAGCEAKIAEIKILKGKEMEAARATGNFDALRMLEEQMAIDIRRAEEKRDKDKAQVREEV